VRHVAAELGIAQARHGMRPDDKLARVRELQAAGHQVAMIGDGVNDAPVLAGADVSIAMGQGAQLAHASADMVVLSERLGALPDGIAKARRTRTVIKQNLGWALFYNMSAVPLAAAGMVAPWMAAIGMSFSSLVVVFNALRLKSD
jgi:Cu2+-exporting ATPase